MKICCPNCGNECETDVEPSIGQHMLCPFCEEKFSYPGPAQQETAEEPAELPAKKKAIDFGWFKSAKVRWLTAGVAVAAVAVVAQIVAVVGDGPKKEDPPARKSPPTLSEMLLESLRNPSAKAEIAGKDIADKKPRAESPKPLAAWLEPRTTRPAPQPYRPEPTVARPKQSVAAPVAGNRIERIMAMAKLSARKRDNVQFGGFFPGMSRHDAKVLVDFYGLDDDEFTYTSVGEKSLYWMRFSLKGVRKVVGSGSTFEEIAQKVANMVGSMEGFSRTQTNRIQSWTESWYEHILVSGALALLTGEGLLTLKWEQARNTMPFETWEAEGEREEADSAVIPTLIANMVDIPGKDFKMGKFEVTQLQWVYVMGDNPSQEPGVDHPVENVSWEDCQEFIDRLNDLPEVEKSGLVFRLPTEEEWFYACRAGAKYDEMCRMADGRTVAFDDAQEIGWFSENSEREYKGTWSTHAGGEKESNGYGLYDMFGNVSEFVETSEGERAVALGGSGRDMAGQADRRMTMKADKRASWAGLRLCASSSGKPRLRNAAKGGRSSSAVDYLNAVCCTVLWADRDRGELTGRIAEIFDNAIAAEKDGSNMQLFGFFPGMSYYDATALARFYGLDDDEYLVGCDESGAVTTIKLFVKSLRYLIGEGGTYKEMAQAVANRLGDLKSITYNRYKTVVYERETFDGAFFRMESDMFMLVKSDVKAKDLVETAEGRRERLHDRDRTVPTLIANMVDIPGKDFKMGKFEVTQQEWLHVMKSNNSGYQGMHRPVCNVTWEDCQEFIDRLNDLPEVEKSGLVFRLPTVEEWTYACRAGAYGDNFARMADGNEITAEKIDDISWWARNSCSLGMGAALTHNVGRKKPNAFGLYDMYGNVSEWTGTANRQRDDGRYMVIGGNYGSKFGSDELEGKACSKSWKELSLGFRLCADRRW